MNGVSPTAMWSYIIEKDRPKVPIVNLVYITESPGWLRDGNNTTHANKFHLPWIKVPRISREDWHVAQSVGDATKI